jgi:2-polyprenyl-3-methyl-5-hydroxy-6-metoxy-1,4-benzoquinol methylase
MRKFIQTFSDHLARYVFASERCIKKSVIDVGVNSGFGSLIMSYSAEDIIGVDRDERLLAQANSFYKYFCDFKTVTCDLEKDFPEGKWDVATCFEVIEHVENPEFLIKNIFEHLNDNGILIFSVPHMVPNRLHKTLFDEQKIKEMISKYGVIEEFYLQDKKTISGNRMYKGLKVYVGVAKCIPKNISI